jgi:inosine-uridine nucleoside N-ribohydrolase
MSDKLDRRQFVSGCGTAMMAGLLGNLAAKKAWGQSQTQAGATKTAAAGGVALRRVIIDTDPGTDDAFALMLAMQSPELKIEARTAVAGNVPLELTLPNALRMVEICGRTDIPVAGGATGPLIRKLVTAAYAHGENGLGGVDFPAPKTKPVAEDAADLIVRLVRQYPGEITLVPLGPLTNIALALRSAPELAQMVPQIVLMGGSLSGGNTTPSAEFNFYVDPEAAAMVFDSGIPITMVGLDVTHKIELTEERLRRLEANTNSVSKAAARIARSLMETFKKSGYPEEWLHLNDPLVVGALLDPAILTLEDYRVEIETRGTFTAGESVGFKKHSDRASAPLQGIDTAPATKDFHPNCKVATKVDVPRFFDLLISRLGREA